METLYCAGPRKGPCMSGREPTAREETNFSSSSGVDHGIAGPHATSLLEHSQDQRPQLIEDLLRWVSDDLRRTFCQVHSLEQRIERQRQDFDAFRMDVRTQMSQNSEQMLVQQERLVQGLGCKIDRFSVAHNLSFVQTPPAINPEEPLLMRFRSTQAIGKSEREHTADEERTINENRFAKSIAEQVVQELSTSKWCTDMAHAVAEKATAQLKAGQSEMCDSIAAMTFEKFAAPMISNTAFPIQGVFSHVTDDDDYELEAQQAQKSESRSPTPDTKNRSESQARPQAVTHTVTAKKDFMANSHFSEDKEHFDDEDKAALVSNPVTIAEIEDGGVGFSRLQVVFGSRYQFWKRFEASITHAYPPLEGTQLVSFMKSFYSKLVSLFVILCNFVFIIYGTDRGAEQPHENSPAWFWWVNLAFQSYYMFELLTALYVFRSRFFFGPETGWYVMDSLLVIQGVMDLALTAAQVRTANASVLRVWRLMKVSRVLKMFDVIRSFKELRIMVDAMLSSLVLFFMCCILMCMLLAIVSIYLVEGVTDYVRLGSTIDNQDLQEIRVHFGTVRHGAISLFQGVTGGNDWHKFFDMFRKLSRELTVVYLLFQAFTFIAFFNVITGVFAEKALDLARPSMFEIVIDKHEQEVRACRELVQLLKETTTFHSHSAKSLLEMTVNAELLQSLIKESNFQTYIFAKGMSSPAFRRFFEELCLLNQCRDVPMPIFLSACIRLDADMLSKRELHTMAIHQLHNLYLMRESLHSTKSCLLEQLESMSSELSSLKSKRKVREFASPSGCN